MSVAICLSIYLCIYLHFRNSALFLKLFSTILTVSICWYITIYLTTSICSYQSFCLLTFVYIYRFITISIYLSICLSVCVYVCELEYACAYTDTHTHIYIYIYIYIYACAYTDTHTHTHTHTHTYIYTHIYIYIYIYVWSIVYPMKAGFFQAVAVSILQYGCTSWAQTKRIERKLDENYTRMMRAFLNKTWKEHPTKQ